MHTVGVALHKHVSRAGNALPASILQGELCIDAHCRGHSAQVHTTGRALHIYTLQAELCIGTHCRGCSTEVQTTGTPL